MRLHLALIVLITLLAEYQHPIVSREPGGPVKLFNAANLKEVGSAEVKWQLKNNSVRTAGMLQELLLDLTSASLSSLLQTSRHLSVKHK